MNFDSNEKALAELGLFAGATKEDIKQTYRKLAQLYHPDVNPDPLANEQYLQIRGAYEYLNEYYEEPLDTKDKTVYVGGETNVPLPEGRSYTAAKKDRSTASDGSRIIGSREALSQAATRRAFKEEHYKQEKRLKKREARS